MKYQEVERIEDEGVVAIITKNTQSGYFSFRIQKEFIHNGKKGITSYLGRRHIPGCRRILSKVLDRLEVLSDQEQNHRFAGEF